MARNAPTQYLTYSYPSVTRRAWVLFATMWALWGLPYLLIKVAVTELEPGTCPSGSASSSPSSCSCPSLFKTDAFRGARRSAGRLVAVAVIGLVLPFLLIAYGETHISSSLAALLIAADPLFIVLLALRFDFPSEPAGSDSSAWSWASWAWPRWWD